MNDSASKAVVLALTQRTRTMKYVCFDFYDKGKFDGMTERE